MGKEFLTNNFNNSFEDLLKREYSFQTCNIREQLTIKEVDEIENTTLSISVPKQQR